MALTISTPYKTDTLASVSGTTFTSNGTPFASTDVGRFIVFTNGAAVGQIRRIVAYVSTSVVTVDLAWDVSNIPEFTDSLPAAGNTWQMSLTFDDIDDGVHIIKDADNSYRQIVAAGLITLNVFLADTDKNLVLSPRTFKIGTSGRLQLGQLHPNGYGYRGCGFIDIDNLDNGWSATSANGNSGDLHLYGCNITKKQDTALCFWRLYRGASHIVRFVDCDFSGKIGGRFQGTRSALIRCTFRDAGIVAPISPFGLIQECRFQASSTSALYALTNLGVGTVTSPRFDSLTGSIVQINSAAVTNVTFVVLDYIESEVTAAGSVALFDANNANTAVSYRQWITTTIVDPLLAPITDTARRVVRDNTATVVSNTTTTSGIFSKITVQTRRFPAVNGARTWGQGVSSAPYEEAVATYLSTSVKLSLPLPISSDNTYPLVTDDSITETTKATVDAYTSINSLDQLYDRAKSWFVDNLALAFPSFGVQPVSANGNVVSLGNRNIVIDATAATAFAINTGTNTITVKTSDLAVGSKFIELLTTGTISFANGGAATARLSGSITYSVPGVITQALNNATLTFSTAGTYDFRTASITGTVTLINTSGGAVTVQLQPGVSFVNTGPNITVDNAVSATFTVSGMVVGSRLLIRRTDNQVVLVNEETTGTSRSYIYTHTADIPVEIVVRKATGSPAYQEWRTTATLTASGGAVVANQVLDE